MKALEALKRIRQETCPATYNPDFDKLKCCDIIEDALTVLQIIYDKEVDVNLVLFSTTYDEYIEEMKKLSKDIHDKEQWWNSYVLDEDEYDLVRNMI